MSPNRPAPPRRLDAGELEHVADGLLLDFKGLPGFRKARLAGLEPVYGPSGRAVEYYEATFTTPHGGHNGYAILSATTADYPVVEFSESAPTYRMRFEAITGHQQFRMVRFGPNYMTAEADHRHLLGEIGFRPTLVPERLQRHYRLEGRSTGEPASTVLAPPAVRERSGQRAERISYETFRRRFQRPAPEPGALQRAWAAALKPRGNPGCTYDYFWAEGLQNHTYYTQIKKNTPPNNNDHASGCGPTAWMNIFGWHDQNWNPSLLATSLKVNDPYLANLTMACHDYIGTYEPWFTFGADQGFTWPSDMTKGYAFAREYLGQASDYWYRHDWWDTDETWVMEPARDVIRAKRPFIVGYYQDWHYAIGYGVAECSTHGWQDHSWIKIYPGWNSNDSDDKWIPKGTIYGIYGAYSFYPMLRLAGIANPAELEITVSGPFAANRLLVATGTAVFHSAGGSGGSWLRGRLSFDVGRPLTATQFKQAVGCVSLASVANNDHAVNAGWAIDQVVVDRNPAGGRARVNLDYAIRDVDGYLYRASYKVSVLAQL